MALTKDQLRQVCDTLDGVLTYDRAEVAPRDVRIMPTWSQIRHAKWMLQEIRVLLDSDVDLDKANRWIGFVQGVLWTHGLLSVDELREMVMAAGKSSGV